MGAQPAHRAAAPHRRPNRGPAGDLRHLEDALVTGQHHLTLTSPLPDPGDQHVFETAVAAGADAIVTFNTKHFPPDVAGELGIEIRHPDEFLVNVTDLAPARAVKALRTQREALKKPPMNVAEFLFRLERANLVQTVQRLGPLAGLL